MKGLFFWRTLLLPIAACCIGVAHAATDTEPNNSCAAAQNVGALDDGQVAGMIGSGDVDYFKVKSALPGSRLEVRMKAEGNDLSPYPLYNSLIGIFDSNCNNLQVTAQGSYSDAVTDFTVPANGKFFLAASSYPDYSFTGAGYYAGAYGLTVGPAPGSISGSITNPDGSPASYYTVALYRCSNPGFEHCDESIYGGAYYDASGHYNFDNVHPEAGQVYQIEAGSSTASLPLIRSATFTVGVDNVVIDLHLENYTLTLNSVQWASESVPDGGSATLNFTVSNGSSQDQSIDAWLMVTGDPTGSPLNFTQFQQGGAGGSASAPYKFTLKPGASKNIMLSLAAPSSAMSGSSGTFNLYLSQSGQPTNVLAFYGGLFYQVVPGGSVSLLNAAESQRRLDQQKQRQQKIWFQRQLRRPGPALGDDVSAQSVAPLANKP
jgi:hypothetical protein